MSAGQITMCADTAVDAVRLFWVNQGTVGQFIQNRANVWVAAPPPPNPDQANFIKLKAIGGSGNLAVVLIGLDNQGALWWAASASNNVWGTQWTRIPAPSAYQYFDAVGTANAGIFVIASRNGIADTQAFDGTNWLAAPGWSSSLPPNSQFTYPEPASVQIVPFLVNFPPPFADVAVDNQADTAPVVCGLTSGPGTAPNLGHLNPTGTIGGGEPFALYLDRNTSDWAWSTMPSMELTGTFDPDEEPESGIAPPYPNSADFLTQYTGIFSNIWLRMPLMLMLGSDGNVYLNNAVGNAVTNWTYGGSLPNPLGLIYTKALWTVQPGRIFPRPIGEPAPEPPTASVILLGKQTTEAPAYPYLITMPSNLLSQDPATSTWQWVGQLPSANPGVAVVDFDIQRGYPDTQVGLLGADGAIYINYQNGNGSWAFYGGHSGKGLP